MIRSLIVLALVVNLSALPSSAAEIVVAENLVFAIRLSDGWTLPVESPEAVQDMQTMLELASI